MSHYSRIFDHKHPFTIGVEEEYMLCDPETGELINRADEIMAALPELEKARYSYELILSEIETNTRVCRTVREAMEEVVRLRNQTRELGEKLGFRIGISGTHPTADPHNQTFVKTQGYQWVADQLQYYARRNITFAIHIHVAVPDGDTAVAVTNALRRWLPPMLAISCNSPFFEGHKTGLLSSRSFQFGAFPRTNVPMTFKSFRQFEELVENFLEMDSIILYRGIWWKIRPHMDFGTIEFRIADSQRSLKNLELIAALSQAMVYQAVQELQAGKLLENLSSEYIEDGLWKAVRFDFDSMVYDTGGEDIISMRDFIRRMGDYCRPGLEHFGNQDVLNRLDTLLETGSEAQEQLSVYRQYGLEGLKQFLISNVEYQLS